jgi:hypothetical protein
VNHIEEGSQLGPHGIDCYLWTWKASREGHPSNQKLSNAEEKSGSFVDQYGFLVSVDEDVLVA